MPQPHCIRRSDSPIRNGELTGLSVVQRRSPIAFPSVGDKNCESFAYCADVCMHAYIERTHSCMHPRVQGSMHACTHARMHACTHARMHACTHARMHACTRARMHACTCTHVSRQLVVHPRKRPLLGFWPVCRLQTRLHTVIGIRSTQNALNSKIHLN